MTKMSLKKRRKKQEIILCYNSIKGGMELVDQMVCKYTCKRATKRRPMVRRSGVLDIAALNAYTVLKALQPDFLVRVSHA